MKTEEDILEEYEKNHCSLCGRKYSKENPMFRQQALYGIIKICKKCKERK